MFSLVYKIVSNKVKEMTNYNYDFDTLDATMKANMDKYLQTYKVEDAKNLNLVKPTEKDMIFYLIYLLECQKKNDSEALENIQKTESLLWAMRKLLQKTLEMLLKQFMIWDS